MTIMWAGPRPALLTGDNMNDIYQNDKWLNMKAIIESNSTFIFVVSGRGIGKTYNTLKALIETGEKFVIIRRSEDEMILCAGKETNPFDEIAQNEGFTTNIKPINKHMYGVYINEESEPRALIMALSTMQKFRGMNFTQYKYIFYDEFIPQTNVKRMRGEGEAVLQMYETINRNRELFGQAPVKLICCANSLDINNDTLISFGIVNVLQKMKKKNIEVFDDHETGLLVIRPNRSKITEEKAQTALYKINQKFNRMALDNDFRQFYDQNIKSLNLSQFVLKFVYDDMFIYKAKSGRKWYVSNCSKGVINADNIYHDTDFEKKAFKNRCHYLHDAYIRGNIIFETAELELTFINLFMY